MQLSLPHSLSSNNDCEPPTQFMISPAFLPSFLSTVWTIELLELNIWTITVYIISCKVLKVRCKLFRITLIFEIFLNQFSSHFLILSLFWSFGFGLVLTSIYSIIFESFLSKSKHSTYIENM